MQEAILEEQKILNNEHQKSKRQFWKKLKKVGQKIINIKNLESNKQFCKNKIFRRARTTQKT